MTMTTPPPNAVATETLPNDRAGGLTSVAPRVSVIIPTHNRMTLLCRAIDSVLAQTWSDLELIVVDDGSDDGTADMVERIADPRVRLVRHDRAKGPPRARNAGIAAARGEWVAFLDNDDEWLPEKLERQLDRIEQRHDSGIAAAYCSLYVQDGAGERRAIRRTQLPEGDVLDAFLRNDVPATPSLYIVKRTALVEAGGFDHAARPAEDLDLWLRLSSAGHRFTAVPEPLAVYHQEEGLGRISESPVAALRSFRSLDKRWGKVMRQRLGEAFYRRWADNRTRRIRRRHSKYLKRLVRSGRRADAWRYASEMRPFAPWGASFVAKALAFALLGRRWYRAASRPLATRGRS